MNTLFKFFIPQDKKFFVMFEKASSNLVEISRVLTDMVNASSSEKRRELITEIERLEHVGDNYAHSIFSELSVNFITPFDREDIHHLISALDDVVDYIHGSAKRIELYKVLPTTAPITKLAELIHQSSQELHKAICELSNKKNTNKIKEACVRINSIENHADDVFDMAIAQLFEDEKNAVEVIKMKEILSALETATDKCEDAANVLESIVVKHA